MFLKKRALIQLNCMQMIRMFAHGLAGLEMQKLARMVLIRYYFKWCLIILVNRNYGPTILPQMEAAKKGYSQVRTRLSSRVVYDCALDFVVVWGRTSHDGGGHYEFVCVLDK